jgi:hypothetical protein
MSDGEALGTATSSTLSVVIAGLSGFTRQSHLLVSGTVDAADAGTTVTVFNGLDAVASGTVATDGSWSADVPLTNGSNILVATDTNSSGTGVSNGAVVEAETAAPVVTIIPAGGISQDGWVTLSGTADLRDAGSTVTILDGSNSIGTATVDARGLWSTAVNVTGDAEHFFVAEHTDALGNAGTSNTAHFTVAVDNLYLVEHDMQTVLRVTPTTAEAQPDAARMDAGLSQANYVSELIAKSANTTGCALLLQSFISGATPTSQSLDQETTTASTLISLGGGNSAAAWQQLGAAFADSPMFNQAYVQKYGALDDTQGATQIYTDILGYAPTPQVVDYLKFELAYYETYYSQFAEAGDPAGVTRARGTMIGDLFGQIMNPRNNLSSNTYAQAEKSFQTDATNNIAKFGDSTGLLGAVGHTIVTGTGILGSVPNGITPTSPTPFHDNIFYFSTLSASESTGAGDDHIELGGLEGPNVVLGTAILDAGAGNDIIQIGNMHWTWVLGRTGAFVSGVQLNAGDGDDQITIGNLSGASPTLLAETPHGSEANVVVNGGSGNDALTVTGTAQYATISGVEQITLSPNADNLGITLSTEQYNSTIRLSGGNDTIGIGPMANLYLNSDGSIATYATVVDFAKGADVFNFSGGGVPSSVIVENQSSLAAALADVSSTTPAGKFAVFEYAGDTYVYQQDSTASVNTGDGLVKLAGVTGLTIGQDLHFA